MMAGTAPPADDAGGAAPPPITGWEVLEAEAATADAAGAAPPPGQAPGAADGQAAPGAPPEQTNTDALFFLITGFRELSCAILSVESPRVTLADDKATAIAGVLGLVADKRGINIAGMLGGNGPELAALLTAGPLLWTAYRELDSELKSKRAAAASAGLANSASEARATEKPVPAPPAAAAGQPEPARPSAAQVGVMTAPVFAE